MTNIYYWGKQISPTFNSQATLIYKKIHSISTDRKITKVKCGSEHAFLLTQNNQIYAIGSNQQGQLGLTFSPHKQLQICRIFLNITNKIKNISCGSFHTLILDQCGNLYSSGKGTQGATGQGINQNSYAFKFILKNVHKISAGQDHSLAIKGNKVYGWGNTTQGQLGLHSKKKFFTPSQLNVYPSNQIYAGAKFSLFLTVKGLYGCGLNNNYQLGLGHQKDMHYPKHIQIKDNLTNIWGGNYNFAKKNQQNVYYIWGTGALGIYKFPTKISFFENCQKFSLGQNFGIVKKQQKIYVWGVNSLNQLGFQSFQSNYGKQMFGKSYVVQNPSLTNLNLDEFQCGNNFTLAISYSKPHYYEMNNNTEDIRDQVYENENFDEQSDNQNNFNLKSAKSVHSLYQKNNDQHNLTFKGRNFSFKKDQQNQYESRIRQNKQKLKKIQTNSLNNRSNSHITIKKNGHKNSASFNEDKIQNLIKQLNFMKKQILNKSQNNISLKKQNQLLKQLMKQQLLKQVLEQQNIQSSKISKNLKNKTKQDLREQYCKLNNLVQNNNFLRNVLNLNNKQDFQEYKENQSKKANIIQNFGDKITKLKDMLLQMNESTKKQLEYIHQNRIN